MKTDAKQAQGHRQIYPFAIPLSPLSPLLSIEVPGIFHPIMETMFQERRYLPENVQKNTTNIVRIWKEKPSRNC